MHIHIYVLDVDKKPAWTGITARADLGGVTVQRERKLETETQCTMVV